MDHLVAYALGVLAGKYGGAGAVHLGLTWSPSGVVTSGQGMGYGWLFLDAICKPRTDGEAVGPC